MENNLKLYFQKAAVENAAIKQFKKSGIFNHKNNVFRSFGKDKSMKISDKKPRSTQAQFGIVAEKKYF